MAAITAEVMALLVCPVPECRAALDLVKNGLRCTVCGRVYPVTDTGPVLIPEEAVVPVVEAPGAES